MNAQLLNTVKSDLTGERDSEVLQALWGWSR